MKKYLQALFITLIVICGNVQKSSGQVNESCFPLDDNRSVEDMRQLLSLSSSNAYLNNYRAELASIITKALEGSKDPGLRKKITPDMIGWILDHTTIYEHSFADQTDYLNGSKFGNKINFTDLKGVKSDWFVFKYEDVVCVWGKRSCGNLQKPKFRPMQNTEDRTPVFTPAPKQPEQKKDSIIPPAAPMVTYIPPQIPQIPQAPQQPQQPQQTQQPCPTCCPTCPPQPPVTQAPQQPQQPAPIQYPQAPRPRRAFWGVAGGVVLAIGVLALYSGRTIWANLIGAPAPPKPPVTPPPVITTGGPGGPGGSGTNGGPGGPGGNGGTGGPGGSGGSGTNGHWEFVNGQWVWIP